MLNAPVFILGSHKSGTSLLRSLLDNHHDLAVMPAETHFFQYNGYWVDYKLRRRLPSHPHAPSMETALRNYISDHKGGHGPYSANPGFDAFDMDACLSFVKNKAATSIQERYELYMGAIYNSFFGENLPDNKRIVEKSVENAEFARILRMLFPDSFFIHIVRNPYATLTSIRKSKSVRHYPFLGNIISSLYNSFYYLSKNGIGFDRYKIIRYEDLINNTDAVMREIAEFIHIKFDDILLKPTSKGGLWKGNSTSDVQFEGVSQFPLDNWKRHITDLEICLTNRIGDYILKKFEYATLKARKPSLFIPAKKEGVITYLMNRLLLWQV